MASRAWIVYDKDGKFLRSHACDSEEEARQVLKPGPSDILSCIGGGNDNANSQERQEDIHQIK